MATKGQAARDAGDEEVQGGEKEEGKKKPNPTSKDAVAC